MTELLAPAGSWDALVAAVESGADAVYLGGSAFGARAYASNFDEEAMRKAIAFAHARSVRVHVAVNTIVRDEEIPALEQWLRFLYQANADAILVQDLGVAQIVREILPNFPMHASTQMTVHNIEGVRALERLGFTRAVLARELSLKAITEIAQQATIELETFVHGALCICYSGQCLMSSMIGGRSGNRGRCAQACRLPYQIIDKDGREAARAGDYLLSPKDLKAIDLVPDLLRAGVSSLKIEGRMKRPEYVSVVVRAYRQAIDAYLQKKALSAEKKSKADHDLAQIFNRDFTTAFLEKNQGKNLISDARPNNRGLLVGRVLTYDKAKRRVTVKLSSTVRVGDQLVFWVKVGGRASVTLTELTLAQGQSVTEAPAGAEITFPFESLAHPHDRIFKVYDKALMDEAKVYYASGKPIRRFAVQAKVTVREGEPLVITLRDEDGYCAEAKTDFLAEKAKNRPLTVETITKQMQRLGTTVYDLEALDVQMQDGVMVPVSEINEARRKAFASLTAARMASFQRKPMPNHVRTSLTTYEKSSTQTQLIVSTTEAKGVQVALNAGADAIVFGGDSYTHTALTLADYEEAANLCAQVGKTFIVNMPRIAMPANMRSLRMLLSALKEHFETQAKSFILNVHNLGTITLARELELPWQTDFSLPVINGYTLRALQAMGAQRVMLSPELTLTQALELAQKTTLPVECLVDAHIELMVSEYCALGSFLGGVDKGICTQPCRGARAPFYLKDRKGVAFPVVTDANCRLHILNSKRLSMLPYVRAMANGGIAALRIEGRYLQPKALEHCVAAYHQELQQGRKPLRKEEEEILRAAEGKDVTRGHYFRGVL